MYKNLLSKTALLTSIVAVIVPAVASAASSQSFSVLNNKTQTGMLASLTLNSDVVEPATDKNAKLLVGIISNNTSDISFTPKPGRVSVQTDGEATALVSTLNGDILIGDRIAPSSLAGVGQKVNDSGWIVGTAQGSLDSKTSGAVAMTVTDTKGVKHKVYVASIPVIIHVTYYTVPGATAASSSSGLPDSVQKIADAIAGKHVSLIGVILSFLLMFIGVVAAGIIVNGTVRGTFTAIARQPLSKASVFRTMARSLAVAGGIVAVVSLVSVVILKLL
jgi:hypothetical protein